VPQRKAEITELKKNHKRHMHNLDIKTVLKKTTKKFLASVEQNNKEEAQANLNVLYKKLDKAAKRNILEDNTVSRRKARYSHMLNALSKNA
jgi:small subunit ribosomal protein S20